MKIHLLLRILFLLLSAFHSDIKLVAQVPTEQFYLPDHDDPPGPFHIRTYVNFIVPPPPATPWISSQEADAKALEVIAHLNSGYNQLNIFFHPGEGCEDDRDKIFEFDFGSNPINVTLLRTANPASVHEGLDIYLLDENNSNADGQAYSVPSTFCHVIGMDENDIPASLSEVLIHEVGHCLGLSHTFTSLTGYPNSDACNQTTTGCVGQNQVPCDCPPGVSPGYCCGDYVNDTPIFNNTAASIATTGDCEPVNSAIDPLLAINFMSYVSPGSCRKEFTPEQAWRMRVYLDNSTILEGIQIKDVIVPGDTPTNPSGNIIVESGEYEVDSMLEMLPDAVIRVKPGATLKINATVTGACDQLWGGVIVEGTQLDLTQSAAYQGQVIVSNTGKIEHARCGIDVQDVNADGPVGGSGGGIVKVISGQIKDNLIGIRYGPYTGASNNKSYFFHPLFSTTDDYRGGAQRPVHLELNTVKGLGISAGYFRELRTECEDPAARAIGIDAKNAGFRVSLSSLFENLYKGIRADHLSELSGSMSVINSLFSQCYKGLEVISSGSFSVYGNEFTVKKPDDCPALPEITGAEMRGSTTGFEFYDNEFASGDSIAPVETLIGTDCIALGEGMGNAIFNNTYSTVFIGNRASGDNGYDNDGLLYLCNKNQNFSTDFLVASGSIRKIQGEIVPGQPTRPTGNTFSGDPTVVCTIVNYGLEIDYYFYDDSLAQEDPGIPGDPDNSCEELGGFVRKEVNEPNGNCDETEPPCFPCPEIDVAAWKTSFYQNRQQWIDKKAAFPYITDEEEREAEAEAIRRLRIAMNRDGSRVLLQYSLDTTDIEVDSLTRWLFLTETYPADLRLARHYFFTGNYAAFDTLWSQIPSKYELGEDREDEFDRLGAVYDTLRAHLLAGTGLGKLPDPTLETLKTWASNCDEPGFLSEVILWRNGVEHNPDCSGGGSRPPASTFTTSDGKQEILKIYPNPANNLLHVEYFATGHSDWLRIFDLQGGLQKEITLPISNNILSIPIGDFNNGLYLLHWLCNGISGYKKVVVSH